jgi:alanine-synthesizing transaminase
VFSSRTRWDLTTNRLSSILEDKRRSSRAVLDLTESNPTRAGIPLPEDLLLPLSAPASRVYEPTPLGLREAREAVATDYERRGFPVGADSILLTASTSEAYSFLFKLLCDAGDHVLAPRPSYPLFEYLGSLESVAVDHYLLAYDGEWHLDVSAIARALTPKIRAVILVNPNNPTGSYLKKDEASDLLALCAREGLSLISDEVFADYALFDDPRRLSSFSRDDPVLHFSLGGLSKSCGLPQLKLSWMAVLGPERLRSEALGRLEIIADTYLSVSTVVQRALPGLLARKAELQGPIRSRLLSNLTSLKRRLPPTATLLPVEGGWSAVLQVPAVLSEEEWTTRLLVEDDVLVHPGYFFDFPREAYFVLSLLTPEGVFLEGIERLFHRVEGAGSDVL